MNIVEPLFIHCRGKPAEIALAAPGTEFNTVSYGRLSRFMNNVSRQAISSGLTARLKVALLIEDPILHAVFLLALTRLGLITVSSPAEQMIRRLSIDVVLSDKPISVTTSKTIFVGSDWISGDGFPIEPHHIHQGQPDDVCRLLLASSNGEQKAIALTNRMMAVRIDRQNMFFGRQAAFCTRTFCDFGLGTPLGFQLLIAMLWRGGALVLPGDPQVTVRSLPIYKIESMVVSPSGLLALLQAAEARPQYQPGLKTLFCGIGAVPNVPTERVRARICSDLTTGYGLAEEPMIASMPAHFASDLPGAVGLVVPGIDLEIVDERDSILPPGTEGILRIRNVQGVTEYLDDSEQTKRAFRNGWFYPGDLGYMSPNDVLVITGRAITNE